MNDYVESTWFCVLYRVDIVAVINEEINCRSKTECPLTWIYFFYPQTLQSFMGVNGSLLRSWWFRQWILHPKSFVYVYFELTHIYIDALLVCGIGSTLSLAILAVWFSGVARWWVSGVGRWWVAGGGTPVSSQFPPMSTHASTSSQCQVSVKSVSSRVKSQPPSSRAKSPSLGVNQHKWQNQNVPLASMTEPESPPHHHTKGRN